MLGKKLGSEISHADFRVAFEDLFNFRLERSQVSPTDFEVLKGLFDTVVWYSPFPADRESYPHYKSEAEIEVAVERARRDLGLVADSTA